MEPVFFTTPGGEDLVLLSRAAYDALVEKVRRVQDADADDGTAT